jgi:hypothetical protein
MPPESDQRVFGRELFLFQLRDLQLFLLRKEGMAVELGDLRLQLAVSLFETIDLKLRNRLASTCHGFSLCGGSGHCGQVNERSAEGKALKPSIAKGPIDCNGTT